MIAIIHRSTVVIKNPEKGVESLFPPLYDY